jgi:hypothetical protein
MDPTLVALAFVVLLPISWLASEFCNRRGVRIALGVLAIAMCYFVAFVAGSLEQLSSNAYFGDASRKLVETTVAELEAGNADEVLAKLRELKSRYQPTYENRAEYKELVDRYAASFPSRKATQ